jgi:hypothetical protein
MIVTASIFSHQTRNVDRKFLQSNLIMYAMYQIAVMIVVGVAVVTIVEGEANTVRKIRLAVLSLQNLCWLRTGVLCGSRSCLCGCLWWH